MSGPAAAAARREQLGASGLWIGLLVCAAVVFAASDASGHLPGDLLGFVQIAWAGALASSGVTVSSVLPRRLAATVGLALGAAAVAVLWAIGAAPSPGPGTRALLALTVAAGATGFGLVVGPLVRRLRRASERRARESGRRAPWRTAGLSGPPSDGDALPLRWASGPLAVSLVDAGPRPIQVVKAFGDLAPDPVRRLLLGLGRAGGPALPLVVAVGLSTEDAHRIATRLRDVGARVEVG